ncbi:MAG: hypothetical protein KAU03_00365, partial [Candidatus Altiarchaeales archaeon]|nr:hypothetical protein [Candidatus Altiarchaeales archaeon]
KNKTLRNLFYVSLALLLIAGFIIRPAHAHIWFEEIPGFYAVYGFIGCALIVIVSKALGHNLLQREEDYYEHN